MIMKIVWNQPKHIRSRATLALLSISPFAAWVIIELSKVTETNPPNAATVDTIINTNSSTQN